MVTLISSVSNASIAPIAFQGMWDPTEPYTFTLDERALDITSFETPAEVKITAFVRHGSTFMHVTTGHLSVVHCSDTILIDTDYTPELIDTGFWAKKSSVSLTVFESAESPSFLPELSSVSRDGGFSIQRNVKFTFADAKPHFDKHLAQKCVN